MSAPLLSQLLLFSLFTYYLLYFAICSDKDDKHEITTPSSAILPSASMGVAAVHVDDCSDSDTEVRLEKVISVYPTHTSTNKLT